MVLVDIVIVLFILIYAWDGYRQGFLRQSCDLIALIISFILALKFFNSLSDLFISWGINSDLAKPLGFFALWIFLQAAFYFFIWFIFRSFPEKIEVSKINKVLGVIPGFIKGLITVIILLLIFVISPISAASKEVLTTNTVSGFLIEKGVSLENQLSGVFGGLDKLTFSAPLTQDHEVTQLDFKTDEYIIDPIAEQKMLDLVNDTRIKEGLGKLSVDYTIREAARAHSIDMITNGYFSHYDLSGGSPADRMKKAGATFESAGENIALAPTTELAETGFMNSPKHRDNIVDSDFSRIGIGIIDTKYGEMVTQNFAN